MNNEIEKYTLVISRKQITEDIYQYEIQADICIDEQCKLTIPLRNFQTKSAQLFRKQLNKFVKIIVEQEEQRAKLIKPYTD